MHPLYFIVAFWAIIICSLRTKNRLTQLIIAFFPFYVMIATRIEWLPDDSNYYLHWLQFHGMDFSMYVLTTFGGKFEPGFWLIEQLPSFNATTILISTVYVGSIIYVIYSLTPKTSYAFFVALFFFNAQFATQISARRTTMALAFYFIAVVLKCKEKNVLSILFAVIAFFFHNTAVFMLPLIVVPLRFAEKHFKIILLGIISIISLVVLYPDFFSNLFIENAEDTALEHYAHYAEALNSTSIFGLILVLFVAVIIVFSTIVFAKREEGGIFSLMYLLALAYFFLSMMNIGQARIKTYSLLFTINFIMMANQQKKTFNTNTLTTLFVIYTAFNYIQFYQRLGSYEGAFSNYESFLF